MTEYNLGQVVGNDGATITSITKAGTFGLRDIYNINLSDGRTFMFTVTNGSNGQTTPLTNSITEGDTTHAATSDAVYQYIENILGDILEYVNR